MKYKAKLWTVQYKNTKSKKIFQMIPCVQITNLKLTYLIGNGYVAVENISYHCILH